MHKYQTAMTVREKSFEPRFVIGSFISSGLIQKTGFVDSTRMPQLTPDFCRRLDQAVPNTGHRYVYQLPTAHHHIMALNSPALMLSICLEMLSCF